MTVRVRSADLRGYVGLLQRNAAHNDRILAYLREWCGAEMQAVNAEGLLAKALNFHDRIYADAENLIIHLGQALRGSAAELEKAAKLYDSSDQAAKDRFNSQHVANQLDREGWEASHSGYADYMNPLDLLHGTPPHYTYSDPAKILDTIGDQISLSGAVFNTIQVLTGVDVPTKLGEFFSGNWGAYSKAAGAWEVIGEALERIGKNIDRGLASLDHAWDGSASEVAYASFQTLANVFKGMYQRFAQVGKTYQEFAQFAMYTAKVVGDIIKTTIDTVLLLLVKKKGAPLFGEAVMVYEGLKVIKYIGYFGWTLVAARSSVAVIFGASAGIGSSPLRGVRAMGYDAATL